MLSRKQGKLRFLQLKDSTESIQLFVSKGDLTEECWNLFDLIDLGDIIEVTGCPMYTKTGQLSLKVKTLKPLTKALKGPNKHDTVQDIETCCRQRYVDLIENQSTMDVFLFRSAFVRFLRNHFGNKGFVEVETPVLSTMATGASAKPFATHHNALDLGMYLRIAPELYLKRLVVGGMDKVFEIGKQFRNEGISTRHNPEFTSLEYYEAYTNVYDLEYNTVKLFQAIHDWMEKNFPEFLKAQSFKLNALQHISMYEAVCDSLAKRNIEELNTRTRVGNDGYPYVFFKDGHELNRMFDEWVEPFLTEDYRTEDDTQSRVVFITSHPVETSPLAKRQQYPSQVPNLEFTERFEVYIDGKEVANAFTELNDPMEQAERFKEQVKAKANGDEEAMGYDEDYINALMHGLPPTGGFGLGIDRMVMLLTSRKSIREVILFPTMR